MACATMVRVLHSFKGESDEGLYWRLRFGGGFTDRQIEKVREEVAHLGGAQMSLEEMAETVVSAAWILERRNELGLTAS